MRLVVVQYIEHVIGLVVVAGLRLCQVDYDSVMWIELHKGESGQIIVADG